MNAEILRPIAFGFSSLCIGGILFLMALVSVVKNRQGSIDTSDGCLATFISGLLAFAVISVLALVTFA